MQHIHKCAHTEMQRGILATNTCVCGSCEQEGICKKDVVTFGCVGKEIMVMMEI